MQHNTPAQRATQYSFYSPLTIGRPTPLPHPQTLDGQGHGVGCCDVFSEDLESLVRVLPTHTHTLTRTRTHAHTQTRALLRDIFGGSGTSSPRAANAHTHIHTHTHTHTHTRKLTQCYELFSEEVESLVRELLTHIYTLTRTLTHTHMHTQTHALQRDIFGGSRISSPWAANAHTHTHTHMHMHTSSRTTTRYFRRTWDLWSACES